MDYFAGLDVSVKETSVCIVDDAGKIVREGRVASEPEALLQVVTTTIYRFKRIGLEAGPVNAASAWPWAERIRARGSKGSDCKIRGCRRSPPARTFRRLADCNCK